MQTRLRLVALALLLPAVVGCRPYRRVRSELARRAAIAARKPAPPVLDGRVVDTAGEPVRGGRIEWVEEQVGGQRTAVRRSAFGGGRFRLALDRRGSTRVRALYVKSGHLSGVVGTWAGPSLTVTLAPSVTWRATVTDEQHQPLAGLDLRVILAASELQPMRRPDDAIEVPSLAARSSRAGEVVVRGVPRDAWIMLEPVSPLWESMRYMAPARSRLPVECAFRPAAAIRGRVELPDGCDTPVTEVRLHAHRRGETDSPRPVCPDERGRFVLGRLKPGTYDVGAETPDMVFQSPYVEGVETCAGTMSDVGRMSLVAATVVVLRVTGPEELVGRPYTVMVRDAGNADSPRMADNSRRRDELPTLLLPPGWAEFGLSNRRMRLSGGAEQRVRIEPGEVWREVALPVEPSASIAVKVTEPDGSPAVGASVHLDTPAGGWPHHYGCRTDSRGIAVIDGIQHSSGRLMLWASAYPPRRRSTSISIDAAVLPTEPVALYLEVVPEQAPVSADYFESLLDFQVPDPTGS